jgi:hypothetical protein
MISERVARIWDGSGQSSEEKGEKSGWGVCKPHFVVCRTDGCVSRVRLLVELLNATKGKKMCEQAHSTS